MFIIGQTYNDYLQKKDNFKVFNRTKVIFRSPDNTLYVVGTL